MGSLAKKAAFEEWKKKIAVRSLVRIQEHIRTVLCIHGHRISPTTIEKWIRFWKRKRAWKKKQHKRWP